MAMSRTAKIWTIVLSIPVGLLLIAIVAAKIYFSSDRLKQLVVPQITSATRKDVALDDISLSVFPSIAVSIDGLRITSPPGSPFSRSDFLALENLVLKAKLLPLLTGKVEISEVTIRRPKIYLEVTKAGMKNFSSRKAVDKALPPPAPAEGSAMGLVVSDIEIIDGELEYVNNKYDSRMLLTGMQQTASGAAPSGGNAVTISGTTTIDHFSYGTPSAWYLKDQTITGTSALTYRLADDVLSLDDVNLKVRELPVKVAGTVSRLKEETMMMDLKVSSPGSRLEQVLSLLPPDLLKKAAGLNSAGQVLFAMNVTGPSSETVSPAITGTFSITDGSIQYAGFPKAITNINVTGSFEEESAPVSKLDIGKLTIEKFTASPGNDRVAGNLAVTNFNDPFVSASINANLNLADIKTYYPLEKGTEISGTLASAVSLQGKAKTPQTMKASGHIDMHNVTVSGSGKPLRNLNGTVTFNNQVVESKQLALNVGESDLTLGFTMKNYLALMGASAGKPSMNVSVKSHQLKTTDFMPEEKAPAAQASSASPKGGGGGLLPGFDVDATVAIDKLVTEKFTFENAKGNAQMSNGIVNLKNFTLNAFQGTVATKGTLDLRDASRKPFDLDLDIKGVESNALLPNFTSFGRYIFGKFSTVTKLQGDLNDTLGLNPQTLLGNGTVQILEGKLLGLPLAQKLSAFTSLQELNPVNFKDWTNAFAIENGRLKIKDLKVNAGSTSFLVGGSQGLDGSLDYALTLKLPEAVSSRLTLPGIASNLVQYLKDNEGRINLTFAVTGTTTSPTLRFDTDAQKEIAKRALEQKGQEAKRKLEEDLKKKATEGLKNLFKRP